MRSLVYLFLLAVLSYRGTAQVISQPDNVTICEGEGAVFTCVLNTSIRSDDVQWYRFIMNTSTTTTVGDNFDLLTYTEENTTSSSLTITNAIKSYTGYFWVGTPSLNVCNASLTVVTSPSVLTINTVKNITNLSIVVQWVAVDDSLFTTYTITWGDDMDQFESVDEQTSYTITELTLDAVYTITVRGANSICNNDEGFKTIVLFSTDATSTISPTVTASTTPMTTILSNVNPSITTTTTAVASSKTITTMNNPTTTDSVATTVSRNADTGTKTTTVKTTISINPSTTTAEETSDSNSNVGIIAGAAAAVGGIIIAITIVLILFIVCYFGRMKNAEKNNYNDLSGDGTLNKTSIPNPLDTNHKLSKPESSQQPEVLHMTSDIGNKKSSHPYNSLEIQPQKKTETQHQQTMEYAVIDNGKKKEQEHQNRETDTQLQQPMEYAVTVMDNSEKKNKKGDKQPSGGTDAQHQPMEYAVVDKSKKKNRKKDKQQDADQEPSDIPTGSTSDGANQNKNDPLLHYADLDTLPAPTDNFINENNSRTPYALVS